MVYIDLMVFYSGSLLPLSRKLGGYTDYYVKYGQTLEPTIPVRKFMYLICILILINICVIKVADLFRSGHFPLGEVLPHGETKHPDMDMSYKRKTDAEKREADRFLEVQLLNIPRIF